MSDRIKWINHQDKKILLLDLSKIKIENEYMKVLDEVENIYKTLEKRSSLILIDVTNNKSTRQTTEKQKHLSAFYQIPKHVSIVGVSGVKKIIAKAVNKSFYFADSIEDAKNWLVNQP